MIRAKSRMQQKLRHLYYSYETHKSFCLVKVKVFGTLVKGLRIGFGLLQLIENEKRIYALLSKLFKLPALSGSDGLRQFLAQFEAAIDGDFPNYQVFSL